MAGPTGARSGFWMPRALGWAALLLQRARAPVPCAPTVQQEVEVGGVVGLIGLTQTLDHGESQTRDCAIVNPDYQESITLVCSEGSLNITVDACIPKQCPITLSIAVALGDLSVPIAPNALIHHGGSETRLCREADGLYRGVYVLTCTYGVLTANTSQCIAQWSSLDTPPWAPRSGHAAVTLSDGAVLLLGGFGEAGALREAWLWSPGGNASSGSWRALPTPPWSGRHGAAAVPQVAELGEQVVMAGGNDGTDRGDVWRWLRQPSYMEIALEDGGATGTQPESCSAQDGGALACAASVGVAGQLWFMPVELYDSGAVHVRWRHSCSSADEAEEMVTIALQLDSCRQLFQRSCSGTWSSQGCTGTDPPWALTLQTAAFGAPGAPATGQWQEVALTLDRESLQVVLSLDGEVAVPVGGQLDGAQGVPVGSVACSWDQNSTNSSNSTDSSNSTGCSALPSVSSMSLLSIEVAAWPGATLEVERLGVTAPAGHWQRLLDEAPWPPRSNHALVALPDGDLVVLGGLSGATLLGDVWRWSPKRCVVLPALADSLAARYEVDCGQACVDSAVYGQWKQLGGTPWAPRQGHAALWTEAGLLLVGGRTAAGFQSDVWRWESSGQICSSDWIGKWSVVTAAAEFSPRQGHSLVGFSTDGTSSVATVLVLAGYGGYPYRDAVETTSVEQPIQAHNDLWCGNFELDGFVSWTQLAPSAPFDPRTKAAAVVAPTLGSITMLAFGGFDETSRFVRDLWRWDGEDATRSCRVS